MQEMFDAESEFQYFHFFQDLAYDCYRGRYFMLYQRSVLRHRSLPPSLRRRGFPMPLHKQFLTKPQWSRIWIAAIAFSLLVIGGILTTR
jgi:hypothetical protein